MPDRDLAGVPNHSSATNLALWPCASASEARGELGHGTLRSLAEICGKVPVAFRHQPPGGCRGENIRRTHSRRDGNHQWNRPSRFPKSVRSPSDGSGCPSLKFAFGRTSSIIRARSRGCQVACGYVGQVGRRGDACKAKFGGRRPARVQVNCANVKDAIRVQSEGDRYLQLSTG